MRNDIRLKRIFKDAGYKLIKWVGHSRSRVGEEGIDLFQHCGVVVIDLRHHYTEDEIVKLIPEGVEYIISNPRESRIVKASELNKATKLDRDIYNAVKTILEAGYDEYYTLNAVLDTIHNLVAEDYCEFFFSFDEIQAAVSNAIDEMEYEEYIDIMPWNNEDNPQPISLTNIGKYIDFIKPVLLQAI